MSEKLREGQLTDPLGSEDQFLKCCLDLQLTGVVVLNCDKNTNIKWWTCQPFSEVTGKHTGPASSVYFPGNTTADLVIPAKTLDYGVHKCTLYVKMILDYTTPVYQSSAFTYIKLSKSSFFLFITSMFMFWLR